MKWESNWRVQHSQKLWNLCMSFCVVVVVVVVGGGVVISWIYTEYCCCWTACCRVGSAAVATHPAELSTEK